MSETSPAVPLRRPTPRSTRYAVATASFLVLGFLIFFIQTRLATVPIHSLFMLVLVLLAVIPLLIAGRDARYGQRGAAVAWSWMAFPAIVLLFTVVLTVTHVDAIFHLCSADSSCPPSWPGFLPALICFGLGGVLNLAMIRSL